MRPQSLRKLAAIPASLAGVALALGAALRGPGSLAGAYLVLGLASYTIAGAGALSAAAALGRREWLGRAWLLVGASFALLLPARLLRTPSAVALFPGELATSTLGNVIGAAAALAGIAGAWLLARTWRASGMPEPPLAIRAAVGVASLVAGALLTLPELRRAIPAAGAGELAGVESVLWSLEYVVLAVVAVPLLHTSVRMGGLLRWPWAYLAGGVAAFLLYDAWGVASAELPARAVRLADEVLRGLGCGLVCAAGLAQRWIVRAPAAVSAGSAPRR
jgi:hypothetical protein